MPPNRQSFEQKTPAASRSARDAAIRRLSRQAGRFPDLEPGGPAVDGLDEREAALAIAIYDASIRRWTTLRFLLDRHLSKPFDRAEGALKAVLLAGAAQLVLLDRVPAHAAINESVEWAKRRIRPGAGKLVNAVLRRVADDVERDGDGLPVSREAWADRRDELPLGDGRARALTAPLLPGDDPERLAVATGLTPELLVRWRAQSDAETAKLRALHALGSPPITLNVRAGAPDLPELLPRTTQRGTRSSPGRTPNSSRCSTRTRISGCRTRRRAARSRAWAIARRNSSSTCAPASARRPGSWRRRSRKRASSRRTWTRRGLQTLRSVFEGHKRVRVVEPGGLVDAALGKGDLVLLDVPCSNSGVLARRLEARHRITKKTLDRLCGVQRQIIADAIPLLAPGGAILYSTCSLEQEENEAQLEWASTWHRFEPERVRRAEPSGLPGGPSSGYADGAFSALLVR